MRVDLGIAGVLMGSAGTVYDVKEGKYGKWRRE